MKSTTPRLKSRSIRLRSLTPSSADHPQFASISCTCIARIFPLGCVRIPLASAPFVLSMSCQTNQKADMQVASEGPTKITKATIDAAWRRRAPAPAHRARQGLPRAGADRKPDDDDVELCLPAAWHRSRDRAPVAEQDRHARQPCDALARRCPHRGQPDQGTGRRRRRPGGREDRPRPGRTRRSRGDTLARLLDDYARPCRGGPRCAAPGCPLPRYVAMN